MRPPAFDLATALRGPEVGLIAEVKRASPSSGPIADADPAAQAAAYVRGGAVAVSVLTEPRHFDGTLADLERVRRRVRVPVLRKDFIVHPSQVAESRAAGADAVLLIAAALDDAELRDLLQVCSDVGLAALTEVHHERDLDRVLAAGAGIVGVNARDLETLEVDEGRGLQILERVPPDRVRVFESGIVTREQVERAARVGADAVLVGEALMRAGDPTAKVRELLGG